MAHIEEQRPIWVRPRAAARLAGLGLTRTYELINSGQLVSRKIDRVRLVSVASIEALGQPDNKAAA